MNTITATRTSFPVLAIGALVLVAVLGFARTYYLRFLIEPPPLTAAVHIHGFLSTLWLALHFTQAKLIAGGRVALHRSLGLFAAMVGAALVAQGADMAIEAAAHGHAPPTRDPIAFLTVSLGGMVTFGSFLIAALVLRRRREWHQRLMYLGSCVPIGPAVGRFQIYLDDFGVPRGVVPLAVTVAFMAWPMVNDLRRDGRVHRAWWIGGAAMLVSMILRPWLGTTEWWRAIGERLVS